MPRNSRCFVANSATVLNSKLAVKHVFFEFDRPLVGYGAQCFGASKTYIDLHLIRLFAACKSVKTICLSSLKCIIGNALSGLVSDMHSIAAAVSRNETIIAVLYMAAVVPLQYD